MTQSFQKIPRSQSSLRSLSKALWRRNQSQPMTQEERRCAICAATITIVEGTRDWVGCSHFPEPRENLNDVLNYRSELS